MAVTKQMLYRTAYSTIGCASFPANKCVGVEYAYTGSNGVNWYRIPATQDGPLDCPVFYPEHHLTNFVL